MSEEETKREKEKGRRKEGFLINVPPANAFECRSFPLSISLRPPYTANMDPKV